MGGVEEICDKRFDPVLLNSVIIPFMANNRPAVCGGVDPNEVHKREIYVTTASTQQQFAYFKASEIMEDMKNGKGDSFCIGNSYELPCLFGLLDTDFIEEKRESPTFSIEDFMREYESIYTGSSSDALVADDKLNKSRVVGIAEWEHCGDPHVDYVLGYDIARSAGVLDAQSALIVIKITRKDDGSFIKEIVNIFADQGRPDDWQARFLKEKVKAYKARMLVVDANGIGSGVVDMLITDLDDGEPPYKVVNDDKNNWKPYEVEDGLPIVYALKSQSSENKNGEMINYFMKEFNKLDVALLKPTNKGLLDLEKKMKKKFKNMESDEQVKAELPYRLTDLLCEELRNLKYIPRAGGNSKVERISNSIQKDKYSALLYGLWWIQLEEKKNKLTKRSFNWKNYSLVSKSKMLNNKNGRR